MVCAGIKSHGDSINETEKADLIKSNELWERLELTRCVEGVLIKAEVNMCFHMCLRWTNCHGLVIGLFLVFLWFISCGV